MNVHVFISVCLWHLCPGGDEHASGSGLHGKAHLLGFLFLVSQGHKQLFVA